jgi:hypothetical protein
MILSVSDPTRPEGSTRVATFRTIFEFILPILLATIALYDLIRSA